MDEGIAIKVDGVDKDFMLPHEKADSIKTAFTGMLKGKKGRTIERQHALKGINIEIKKGEFFGIVGRNGSGKSTLLKIIAGIYQPTKGKITTNGRLVPFIELGVGFNPELTGRENVYLNGALMGFSKNEIDAKYEAIVDFAEIHRFMDQKLKNYSSGMQVRLAFSVATVLAESDILLIDEVLAVGDADFQRKCYDYFRKLKNDNKTVIFVSHDMNAVREYCDRAVMIEKSEMIAEGNPEDVALTYTKMFMQNDDSREHNEDGQRWGDGSITYSKVSVEPKTLKGENSLKIVGKVKARELVENPIFGFVIKNAAGSSILGTNSKIKHQTVKSIDEGEELTVEWEVPNVFGDGNYVVNVAVQRSDGTRECDWWEGAASFRVFKEERTPYIITPNVNLTIKHGKATTK